MLYDSRIKHSTDMKFVQETQRSHSNKTSVELHDIDFMTAVYEAKLICKF